MLIEWDEVLMEWRCGAEMKWGEAVLSFMWKSVKQFVSWTVCPKSALNNLSTVVWPFNVPPKLP